MSDDRLYLLAQRAGLSLRWTDYQGVERSVAPDALRRVLRALHLPADSEVDLDSSLEKLDVAALLTVPEMIVGRAGVPTALPPALAVQPQETLRVQLEQGGVLDLCCAGFESDGRIWLPPVDQIGYHRLEIGGQQLTLAIAPNCGFTLRELGDRRRFGLSAQLYGLRRAEDFGIGDFAALGELARAAATRGVDAIAISPTHALFSADPSHYSPYSPSSRLFLNVLHSDIDHLVSDDALRNWIAELGLGDEVARLRGLDLIDWRGSAGVKMQILRRIWSKLGPRWIDSDHTLAKSYRAFCKHGSDALRDHTRFEALHAAQFGADPAHWHWRSWAPELRNPRSAVVERFAQQHADEVKFHCFLQWLAAKGLGAAQHAARESGMAIGLIADLAVGTADGGSHVWSHPDDFLVGLSAGAPPDAINTHGQNWGLTTFSPMALRTRSYAPFIDTLRAALRHSGGLRIDHILGIRRLWVTPDGADASDGVYLAYPEQDLLALIALESSRHRAIIIGEDLGTVPPGFSDMINRSGLLGMQVLWFQRDQSFFVEPSRWSSHAMATTSTHDLPTVSGWWRGRDIEWHAQVGMLPPDSSIEEEQVQRAHDRHMLWGALLYAGVEAGEQPAPKNSDEVVNAALQLVAKTPSPLAIFSLDDIYGGIEQPNLPGTINQHPNWRRRLPQAAPELLQQPVAEQRLEMIRQSRDG